MRTNCMTMECTCDAAPVQYEGTCATWSWYFRARWDRWQFGIGATFDDAVNVLWRDDVAGILIESDYGVPGEFEGSYMPHDEAERIIMECLEKIVEADL